MARKRFKTVVVRCGAIAAFEQGKADIEELHGQIESWKENLEEKLSHSPKYTEVEECLEAISEVKDKLEGVDWPEGKEGEDAPDGEVSYTEYRPTSAKRGTPRWMQFSSAQSAISAAKEWLEGYVEEHGDEDGDIQSAIDDLGEAAEADVNFPSMF